MAPHWIRLAKVIFVTCVSRALVTALREDSDHGPPLSLGSGALGGANATRDDEFGQFGKVRIKEKGDFSGLRTFYNVTLSEISVNFPDFDGTCGEQQTGSAGKSGACFFLSKSRELIVKTMTKTDAYKLLEILPDYTEYIRANPKSLLTKYLSSFKVYEGPGKNTRFVVMTNCLRPFLHTHSAHFEFDLKGTIEDRFVRQSQHDSLESYSTGKDLNFENFAIYLPVEDRDQVLEIIANDTKTLKGWRLMDYSIILRVEELGECDIQALSALCHKGSGGNDVFAKHNGYLVGVRNNIIYAYSFGIIDLLQGWYLSKMAAGWLKGVRGLVDSDFEEQNRDTAEPEFYQERFENYFKRKILSAGVETESVRGLDAECEAWKSRVDNSSACEIPPSTQSQL